MNFIAHAHVALRCPGAGWEQGFGATLPDLASMAGTRIQRSLLPASVEEGVVLHHRADRSFHGLAAFHAGAGQIRRHLLEAGVSPGPARAVGHAGYELLLDGCLLTRAGVKEEFSQVLERAPEVAAALAFADPGRWAGLVAAMRGEQWWLGYTDPQMVARGLQRLLRARPLLRFSETELPIVAAVLSAARPAVDAATDDIIDLVVQAIEGEDPPR